MIILGNFRAAGLENDLEEKRVYIDKLQSELERVKRDSEEMNLANQAGPFIISFTLKEYEVVRVIPFAF